MEEQAFPHTRQPEGSKRVPGGQDAEATARLVLVSSKTLGLVGFAFMLSWIYLLLMGYVLLPHADTANGVPITIAFFVLGQLVASFLIWLSSQHRSLGAVWRERVSPLALPALFLTPLPSVAAIAPDTGMIVRDLAWVLAGIGAVSLLALWGTFLARLSHREAVLYLPLAMLVNSVVVFLALNLVRVDVIKYVTLALPLLSIVLFAIASSRPIDTEGIFRNPGFVLTRPPDAKTLVRSSSAMLSNSLLLGFVFYVVSITRNEGLTLLVCAGLLAAALFKVYDALDRNRFEISQVIKVLAPTAALGLLPLPYADASIRFVLVTLVVFIGFLTDTVVWTAISEYTRINRIVPYVNIAFGRIGSLLGLGIGYVIAFLVFGSSPLDGELSNPLILVGVVFVISVLQIFIFRDNYTPFFTIHCFDPGPGSQDVKPQAGQGHSGRWRQRCESFGKACHLTPRQKEVMMLLAKGYSTSYIEEILVVSEHTIKAHIYGIYRKANVHSRQELIEMIERHPVAEEG
ncbi:MAG: LuxR C-terminal-related transcriptional regulator [Coriobacteriaceae bacterium]|jgi:DNA-binding CsgD family transcriptional regulator|nr:LuxR C-terminal-related transcriptional regulator [Coriobacteriaceae bacterium]